MIILEAAVCAADELYCIVHQNLTPGRAENALRKQLLDHHVVKLHCF